ncbi:MAG TPA: hypothetical protein VFS20_08210 [Longimicrobium sp.]|nr:hypothetical protein [Longimicrobium sp.]
MRPPSGRAGFSLVLGAVLGLALGGCLVPGYRFHHERDDFERIESWRMSGNALSQPAGSADWIALDAEAVRPRGDSVRYALVVDYRAADEPLGLRRGESLIVLADTARYVFSTDQVGLRKDLRGPRETARYPVSRDAMRRIALAGRIRVRVIGRSYYVDRNVTNRGLWRFRELMEAVEGIPVPPRPSRRAPSAAPPQQPAAGPGRMPAG